MNLIHSVLIQTPTTTYDAEAMPVRAWATLKTMAADVQPKALTANEVMGFGITNLQSDAKEMFFSRDLTIVPGLRVIFGTETFEIRGTNHWAKHSEALLIPVQGVAAVALSYSVVYDGNGATSGAVPTDPNLYATGASVTVLGNTGNLGLPGYTFGGWAE